MNISRAFFVPNPKAMWLANPAASKRTMQLNAWSAKPRIVLKAMRLAAYERASVVLLLLLLTQIQNQKKNFTNE